MGFEGVTSKFEHTIPHSSSLGAWLLPISLPITLLNPRLGKLIHLGLCLLRVACLLLWLLLLLLLLRLLLLVGLKLLLIHLHLLLILLLLLLRGPC